MRATLGTDVLMPCGPRSAWGIDDTSEAVPRTTGRPGSAAWLSMPAGYVIVVAHPFPWCASMTSAVSVGRAFVLAESPGCGDPRRCKRDDAGTYAGYSRYLRQVNSRVTTTAPVVPSAFQRDR